MKRPQPVLSASLSQSEWQAQHRRKVERVAAQLRAHSGTTPISLRKKSVAHQVPKGGDLRRLDDKIDVSDLDSILHIDPVARVCIAESGVTYVDLVAATMVHGLVPIVVPELKTITIGGAVSGCSLESMSFKYGGFHDTCLAYEVLTASGDILECAPEGDNALVFHMMQGAFGTLGILTQLTFKLVPAKSFVKVTYEKYTNLADYQAAIREHVTRDDLDFMDGMIHSQHMYVLSAGHFVEHAPYTSRYDWMKIYYRSTLIRAEDYLTTPDYFFRYDRGVTNVRPSSFLARLFFGKFVASSQVLRLAEKLNWLLPRDKPTVTLDIFLPFSKMPEFLEWYAREFNFYPLWCVPYRRVHDYEWIDEGFYARMQEDMFVDLAIYGMKQTGDKNYHRLMEEKLRELGGIKTLISHNYYTESEFWQTWNKRNYDTIKARTDPKNVFRDLYTKTCRAAMGLR